MPLLGDKPGNKPASILAHQASQNSSIGSWLGLAPDRYIPSAAKTDLGLPAGTKPAFKPLTSDPEQGECANPDCKGSWTLPWRSKRRLTFEGKYACRGRCLEGIIKTAIAREGGDRFRAVNVEPHRHRVPLGLVMLAQGWITHPQLQKALESQRITGKGRVGDWLVSECGIETECVARALSIQWSCPTLTTDGFSPQTMAAVLPKLFIKEYNILPLRIAGSKILYLGFQDHLDASAAFAVERICDLRTESGMVPEQEFRAARNRLLECNFPPVTRKSVSDGDALAASVSAVIEKKQPASARLVRLHQYYWLRIGRETEQKAIAGVVPSGVHDVSDYLFIIGAQA